MNAQPNLRIVQGRGNSDNMPRNIEAEQGLLGAILVNNDAFHLVSSIIQPAHFFEQLHQIIYEKIQDLILSGKRANPITLKVFFQDDENVGELTMNEYLARLATQAATVINAPDFAQSILNMSVRRQMIDMAHICQQHASNRDTPEIDALGDVLAGLNDVQSQLSQSKGSTHFGAIFNKALDGLQAEAVQSSRIAFFLPELTAIAGDMRPGNLIGLPSDSGGGKTSWSLQQLDFTAGQGTPCAFLSIEVTAEEAALQIACQRMSIDMDRLDRLELSQTEQDMLGQELERARKIPLQIIPFGQCTLEDIKTTCMEQVRLYGCKLVIIDHAKYITLPGKPNELFSERVNALYRGLKSIAKELHITVVILIQRNDAWKKRDNPRPIDGDLYGGGSVKQSMDVLIALYRPEPLLEDRLATSTSAKEQERLTNSLDGFSRADGSFKEGVRGKAWLINMKRRRGKPKQDEVVRFNAPFTRFESIEREQEGLGI